MGLQPFYGTGPHSLLRAGPRAARGKIIVSGVSNYINYCEIFIVYTQFKNAARGPRIGSQCLKITYMNDKLQFIPNKHNKTLTCVKWKSQKH
jgi:hypothetical protein